MHERRWQAADDRPRRVRAPVAEGERRPRRSPSPPGSASAVLDLQRRHGNRYVQRAVEGSGGDVAPPVPDDEELEERIRRALPGGHELDPSLRQSLEGRLGADLGAVRVHSGAEADTLARALGARAFTTGSDIFFRAGEYDPRRPEGVQLLAHELTHVLQQAGGIQRSLVVDEPGDPLEQEASRVAREVVEDERDER